MQLSRWFKTTCAAVVAGGLIFGTAGQTVADVKAGDTVTKENMASAEEFLIPSMKWYVEHGMPMKIIDYKKIEWPKAYKEATEKYSGQVKISPDGRDMLNYVAGAPFPQIDPNDPLVGFKIMWNQEQKPAYTDNVGTEWIVELINSKGEMERRYSSGFWRRMMWTGRLYTDPKPVVPHNPAMRYTEQFGPLFEPNDLKGAGVLSNRYMAADMPDDSYMYLPELRRVRRISVSNRSDAFWGTDYDLDALWGFNSKVGFWTFRLLAEKEILAPMHSGQYGKRIACKPSDGTHGTLAFMPCGINWEKRKVWVVEGLPTAFSQYAFSKRLMYIDKETLGVIIMEAYDQGGELWRVFFNHFDYSKKPYEGYPARGIENAKYNYEDEWAFDPHGMAADLQTAHGSPWDAPSGYAKPTDWVNEWYFNESVPINTPEAFSINNLIQSAR
jgi:hypothetical protein